MLEILMDSEISTILAELEDGEKDTAYISEKLNMPENVILNRLSYVIEHGFVVLNKKENLTLLNVDKNKLNKIMEMDENFSSVVDGLTELDQYLN